MNSVNLIAEYLDAESRLLARLERRLGVVHARQRLGIENDHAQRVFGGGGLNFFHPENWYSIQTLMRCALKMTRLYEKGRRNACNIELRRNRVQHVLIPEVFNGYRILHLSDLHLDMDEDITRSIIGAVRQVDYDVCVLTGDYRAQTFGSHDGALEGLKRLKSALKGDVYAVLGNHDSIRMLPAMEDMGYRLLLNEGVSIQRRSVSIQLAGVDDPHYYRVDNLQAAAEDNNLQQFSMLLSHTPEIFRQAAHAGFHFMMSGHTHGGQICFPGGIPITLDSDCPRFVGKGAWHWGGMLGYTSVGAGTSIIPIRFNCPPEITLHTLTSI
ncbi:metallophosphoesterase [Hahella sp. CCB-MM4]|uniref:metallophosphoesterase n=1 Tax=Hahella sp. (strain CCB-MM4) TaxID=1926491 RepID=UPI000B9A63B1|nr:metallophosphoesterase [Hahella sp. CCB-MM4]OZG72132.1 metallophosphoesterase [Hahella sp. CCB-MM4]